MNLGKTRSDESIRHKVLYLIKKWGERFEKQQDIIPNFYDVYISNTGIFSDLPIDYKPNYLNYVYSDEENLEFNLNAKYQERENIFNDSQKTYENQDYEEGENNEIVKAKINKFSYSEIIDINPKKFDGKYKKYILDLHNWLDNIELANVFIFILKKFENYFILL